MDGSNLFILKMSTRYFSVFQVLYWAQLKGDIKVYLNQKESVSVYWIRLTQDTVEWQFLINMVMNLLIP
jgi:hypothetical protein